MKRKSLIISQSCGLAMALPSLLARAGFVVDVIATGNLLSKSKFVRNFKRCWRSELLGKIAEKNLDDYDFIIPCDDDTLALIRNSDFSTEKKLKLLPIFDAQGFEHIYSKIGLSKILKKSAVLTPEFFVVGDVFEAKEAAKKLGYPVMVKKDSSSGGCGVFECCSEKEIDALQADLFSSPLLVQKKIIGRELDLSGFYFQGELIFFSFSEIKKVTQNRFGPSVLRLYSQLGIVDEEVFSEMRNLGKALFADGFTMISCIETADKKRYFIEADMRPNVWADFPKFFGDDSAKKISAWFSHKEILQKPRVNENFEEKLVLPFFNRMLLPEILLNRYRVWKCLPWEESEILFFLLSERIFSKARIVVRFIKRFPTNAIRLVFPCKNFRAKLRGKVKRVFSVLAYLCSFGYVR